mmetsp:Transcript_38761/g.128333  ORF Transcript_38761/g.128333 Transcript_38761/m.128333 type:complete len:215 (+) Transcript_38761:222-866(+)
MALDVQGGYRAVCGRSWRVARRPQRGTHFPISHTPHTASAVATDRLLGALLRALPALLQILLVIILGRPEALRRLHLRLHRAERLVLAHGREHLARDRLLLLAVRVDAVPVLRAAVVAHLVEQVEAVAEPLDEQLAQAAVRHLVRVEDDLHRLGVPRAAAAHLLVGRLGRGALRVADSSAEHARLALVGELEAPEAAAGEGGGGEGGGRLRRDE